MRANSPCETLSPSLTFLISRGLILQTRLGALCLVLISPASLILAISFSKCSFSLDSQGEFFYGFLLKIVVFSHFYQIMKGSFKLSLLQDRQQTRESHIQRILLRKLLHLSQLMSPNTLMSQGLTVGIRRMIYRLRATINLSNRGKTIFLKQQLY